MSGEPLRAVAWRQRDGAPVSCQEKLRVLNENRDEILAVLRDAFEDAVLMGVDPAQMREDLHGIVDGLRSPDRS